MNKSVIAFGLSLSLLSVPAMAESGKMVKKAGTLNGCTWFQTLLGTTNQLDPKLYAFSKQDSGFEQNTISLNSTFGSTVGLTFSTGTPPVNEHYHPDDCPLTDGLTYVFDMVRAQ